MGIRKTLSEALDPSLRTGHGLSKANTLVVILICLSITLGIAETEVALTDGFELYYEVAHLIFFVIFLAEYLARVYSAPENPRYRSSIDYALTPSSILDLLVLVSFVLPFIGALLHKSREGFIM